MAKKQKVKKSVKRGMILIIILVLLSILGIKFYNEYLYKQTYEYKLLEINYSIDESKILIDNLNDKELNNILGLVYNSNISKLVTEKYFIFSNLERYLDFINKDDSKNLTKIVAMVNVNRDREYYEDTKKASLEDYELMLVNKYNYLEEDYEPKAITTIPSTYAYEGNKINEEVLVAFRNLAEEAKIAGHTILINSSYRDYNSQKEVWESRKSLYGTRQADAYAARAGYSEHQTGYAIDVADFYDINDKFGETESFLWMKENCYSFGFILRYPEDKEKITGYSYEPWHYRYVGKEVAEKIKNLEITFDEYYAYFIANI
ncbi:MAG: M15 family metallopeptidase [Bacilli bacterium]|nr:M15 family metallopeptidase [Bacilli bacterium]